MNSAVARAASELAAIRAEISTEDFSVHGALELAHRQLAEQHLVEAEQRLSDAIAEENRLHPAQIAVENSRRHTARMLK